MENTQSSSDFLIDDAWCLIFAYFGAKERACFARVSTKWRDLIHKPSNWPVFELSFLNEDGKPTLKRNTTPDEVKKLAIATGKFIGNYCTSLVDLWIELPWLNSEMVDIFFQIKTLRRFALHSVYTMMTSGLLYSRESYKPKQPPACKDLRVLALEAPLMSFSESLETVLSTLPNLEEYYMNDMRLAKHSTFSKSKKLRIIGVRMLDLEPLELVEWCPSLEYVVFNWQVTTGTPNPGRGFVKKVKNTTLISDDTFDLLGVSNLEQAKLLGSLLSPYTYDRDGLTKLCYLLYQKKFDQQVFRYLVKELKWDINERAPKRMFSYRPIFQSENAYKPEPGMLLWERPLDIALTKTTSMVKLLLELGAKVEFPHENNSFLLKAFKSEDRMLLLKNGADPNKLIDGVPVFMKLFTKNFDDAPEVVYELVKRKCDLNFTHNGDTALSIAVSGKRWDCVEALLKNGANWTASALRYLLVQDIERAKKFLKLRNAELEMLDLQTAAIVVHRRLVSCFSGSFDGLKNKREETNNMTLLHLVAMNAETPVSVLVPERRLDTSRWVVVDDEKALLDTRKGFTDFNQEGSGVDRASLGAKFSKLDPKDFAPKKITSGPAPSSSTAFSFTENPSSSSNGGFSVNSSNETKTNTNTPSSAGFNFAETSSSNTGGGFSFSSTSTTTDQSKPGSGFNFAESQISVSTEAQKTPITTPSTGGFSFAGTTPLIGDLNFSTEPNLKVSIPTTRYLESTWVKPKVTNLNIEHEEEYISSAAELQTAFFQITGDINAQTNNGETALLLVCKAKMKHQAHQDRAIALILNGADVNIADKNGWTPLHAACYRGSWMVVATLLQHKANINAQDKLGITPPMAALYGFKHCASLNSSTNFEGHFLNLIQAEDQTLDVQLTEKESKRTLLHLLACVGGVNLVTAVVGRGADLNSRDADGFTPMHYALMFDNVTVVKLLMEFGADINAQTTALKLTPLMMFLHMLIKDSPYNASLQRYNTLLFAEPSEVKSAANLGIKIPPLYEAPWNAPAKFSLEMVSYNFKTEVHRPVRTISMLQSEMTAVKVKPELKDVHGNTLLHLLPQPIFAEGSLHLLLQTVFAEGSLHLPMTYHELWNVKNDDGDTPFHLVCRNINQYLDTRVINALDGNRLAIHRATFVTESLRWIKCDKITNANEPDSTGVPPLHHILQSNLPESTKQNFFTTLGVVYKPIEIVQKATFLKSALKSETGISVEQFANLLNYSGDPAKVLEEKDEHGSTLFLNVIRKVFTTANEAKVSKSGSLMTVQTSWMRIFDYLLNSGLVDLSVADKNGNTAIHIAGQFYHTAALDSIYGRIGNFNSSSVYCLVAYKLIAAGADTMAENKKGETVYDYVPNLMEHYKSIYKKLIKDELKYTDTKP